jgi:nucleoside-diphosphate-sugar epimerase
MSSESAIPKGSTVLVTGANGYIGSHIADQLILAGYNVKGTVRSEDKGAMIAETFEKRHSGKGAFSYVVVEDMSTEEAFHDAMKGEHRPLSKTNEQQQDR